MFARRSSKLPIRSVTLIVWSSMVAASMFSGCQVDAPSNLVIVVEDSSGNVLRGAEVLTRAGRARTDALGRATIARPAAGRGFVSIRADKYAPFAFDAGEMEAVKVPLIPQGKPIWFDATQEVDVSAVGQVRITMDPNALIDLNGDPVAGMAQVTVVPIDPHGPQQSAIPLPQVEMEGGKEPQALDSVVLADISFWRDGAPVQLAPGKTATVEMLLPEAAQSQYETGETIDGFWFDVDAAIWKKGTLGLVLPSTFVPGKKSWIAAVDHFTFWGPANAGWNPAIALDKQCINITTKDANSNPPGAPIGGVRVQVLGEDYAHIGPPAFTNWSDPMHLGEACLEFQPQMNFELKLTHPAVYKITVPTDPPDLKFQPSSLVVGTPSCNQDPQKHGVYCSMSTVEIWLTTCGNGILQPGEGCDDGNTNNLTDGCTTQCQLPACGDGYLQVANNEQCDDGNLEDNDDCKNGCILAACGDGIQNINGTTVEECDDGNLINTDMCTTLCKAPFCGDKFIQPALLEACDDGNIDNDDQCTTLCQAPFCGDGFIQTQVPQVPEECDNGQANSNTGTCKLNCELQVCGDGFVGPAEQCDDGNQVDNDGCTTLCKTPFCGDGLVTSGEQCDNGLANSNTGTCKLDCQNQVCGDGFVGPAEQCDDANQNNNDGCTQICQPPFCGDGFIQLGLGEACDDVNQNNDDTCTTLCQAPFCGDGFIQTGEQCDNGPANSNTGACKLNCVSQICGDGYVGPGEQCDDGDQINNNACSNNCTSPTCGDGTTQAGSGEQCDDGKSGGNDDGCTDLCLTPVCGDGFVQINVASPEACDDGNQDNDDACTTLCQAPYCGDGFVQINVASPETCDDGNQDNNDGCTTLCAPPECGDGFLQTGEACDDGNTVNGDGCEGNCQLPAGQQLWTAAYNGPAGGQDRGYAVAADANGDFVVTGLISVAMEGFNVWTRKYAANGVPAWTATFNGADSGDDFGYGVAFAPNGNVIVTGVTSVVNQGYDVWVQCYDASGAALWSDAYNNPIANGFDTGYNVAIDGNNGVVVVGTENVGTKANIWLRKYDSNGAVQWTQTHASSAGYTTNGANVAIAGNGDVVVTAYEVDLMATATGDKIVYLHYDPTGLELPGTQVFDGLHHALATAVDGTGDILVTGFLTAPNDDIWVAKYSIAGSLLWQTTYSGPAAGVDRGQDIAADLNGNIIVAGYTTVSGQGANFWVQKLLPGGAVAWTQTYNGSLNGNDIANGIASDSAGNILVTGYDLSASGQGQNVRTIKYSP